MCLCVVVWHKKFREDHKEMKDKSTRRAKIKDEQIRQIDR